MQDSQENAGEKISIGIDNDSDSNSEPILNFKSSRMFHNFEMRDFERPGKIASISFLFVIRYIHWFIFVEFIHTILASLGGMLNSVSVISYFAQEYTMAGILKTALSVLGLVLFVIFGLFTYGALFIIPLFFLWIYYSQAHIFKKYQIVSNLEFNSAIDVKPVRKQDFEKFNKEKLVSIFTINVFVCIAAFAVLIILNNIVSLPSGGVKISRNTLWYHEIFLCSTIFITYVFFNSFIRFCYVVILFRNVYDNSLRSLWQIYKEYFLEFIPFSILFSVLVGVVVSFNALIIYSFINVRDEETIMYISIVAVYITFTIENTFWVLFVKSRLPGLKKFLIESEIAETKRFAKGTTENGEILRQSTQSKINRTSHAYGDFIRTDEEVWSVDLEDVDEEEDFEDSEKADDSKDSDAKVTEN